MAFSPFSLFIKPGLLTLKQHSDRGAKRKKDLQEKNRKEGEKDLGTVSDECGSTPASVTLNTNEEPQKTSLGGMKFLTSKECKEFYLPLITQVLE